MIHGTRARAAFLQVKFPGVKHQSSYPGYTKDLLCQKDELGKLEIQVSGSKDNTGSLHLATIKRILYPNPNAQWLPAGMPSKANISRSGSAR